MADFEGVQDTALGAIAEALARQPLTPGKVAFAWRAAVGPGIDKATTVSLDVSGVLRVRASNRQWAGEVERATSLIETRLSRLLGAGTIRRIDVT